MKKLTLLLASLFSLAVFSQSDPRVAHTKTPLTDVPLVVMPHQDNEGLLAEEMERRGPGIAPKFAVSMAVDINPATHGYWEQMADGNMLWRLRIRSEGAKSLNLGFTKYVMPDRGSLVIYTPDQQTVMGPFTPADNEEHEQFWTPMLPGEELVLEVKLPAFQVESLQLELKSVNHDFLGFAEVASGSCNLDVICGAADGWAIVDRYRDIIQSVGVYTLNGQWFCTGFLVNNARQDCAAYFMTANHCEISTGNDQTVVTYWNFLSPTCRQPNSPASGGNGNGSLNDFNSGTILRANYEPSDFALVEFEEQVSPTANAFYAGWSAESFAPTDSVIVVHHPSTDEKRISFDFDPTYIGTWDTDETPVPNGDHIVVADYDIGTTEGGSSGAPLFNRQKRVVGQLHGGDALCNNDFYDSYGWFYKSWTGGGTPNTRLKDWLDPDNTGIITLDGRSAMQCSFFVEGNPATLSVCAPTDLVYEINVSSNFTADVTLATANLPAGLSASFGQNPLPPGGTTTLTLSGTASLAEGTYGFELEGTDGTESSSSDLQFFVAPQTPAPPTLNAPANGANGIGLTPDFAWTTSSNTTYDIEVATDPDFTNIIETSTNLSVGAFTGSTPLAAQTTYYWRVRGKNICGEGNWPTPGSSFTTGAITCSTNPSTDVPVEISESGTPSVISTITITTPGSVDDINLRDINIEHSFIGDLRAELTSPSGTTIRVFTNPGNGNCSQNDILVGFDDEAVAPYSNFAGACGNIPPAIEGTFQPFEALSAFNGEPAAGEWVLTVYDIANVDGGAILGWGLDVCAVIPNDMSVVANNSSPSNCLGGESSFALQLGTAFDGSTGVTLVANGLPQGATATFSPNPAAPGAQVNAVLSGASIAGSYSIEIVATDALNNSGTANIQWNVLGVPLTPTPLSPMPNATGVTTSPVFSWSNVTNDYRLLVATDPGMANVVYTGNTPQPSLVVIGLEPCTDYYWTVTSLSNCGDSQPSTPQLFTTEDDLTFNITQGTVSSCPTGNVTLNLVIGQCFSASGVTLSTSGLPSGATISFIQNPLMPGGTYILNMNLTAVPSGSYLVALAGNDGVNNVVETFTLNVNPLAAAPVLVAPANAATGVNVKPMLDWNNVPGATGYFLEVATDANFNNLVFSTATVQTQFTFVTPLNVNTTYYWHVIASNNCGTGIAPATFSFTTWLVNGTTDLNGLTVSVQPNPTSGLLNAIFSKTTEEKMDATLHSVNGVLVKQQQIALGSKSASFDLSALPSGVYLLRLRSETGVLTKKIILEK